MFLKSNIIPNIPRLYVFCINKTNIEARVFVDANHGIAMHLDISKYLQGSNQSIQHFEK